MVKEFEQNVRIVASTVTINVAVSGTVQVNIASISPAVTFNVAIQSSAVTLNVAIQSSSVTLNVSVQNAYLYIRTETGQNLNIDIKAQSVGNLNVAIASSAITLNVAIQSSAVTLNVAIQSSVTLNVNIASQGAFNLNVAIQSSAVTLQVNIASQTSNLNVNIAASAITLQVNIASQTANLNINIAASSATISIQTTGGIEIGVGKKETTPIGRTISNDAGTGQWLQSIATDKYGKLFPNSMRGQLHNIPIYVKNATAGAVNLVLKYAVRPLLPDQFSTSTSIPATSEGWVNVAVAKYWDYDSLFVYAENATLSIGMDTPASDNDADCFAYISGAWQWLGYRPWIRANLKVQTHYAVTVDGQVSVKDIDDYIQPSPEYFINKGQAFAIRAVSLNLAAGATGYTFVLYNPSNSGKTAYIFGIIARSTVHPLIVDVLKITGYTGGTALTPVNLRFGDSKTSAMTVLQNVTSFTGGDFLASIGTTAELRWYSDFPIIILPPNSYVLIETYNAHTATDNMIVIPHWYEA